MQKKRKRVTYMILYDTSDDHFARAAHNSVVFSKAIFITQFLRSLKTLVPKFISLLMFLMCEEY